MAERRKRTGRRPYNPNAAALGGLAVIVGLLALVVTLVTIIVGGSPTTYRIEAATMIVAALIVAGVRVYERT